MSRNSSLLSLIFITGALKFRANLYRTAAGSFTTGRLAAASSYSTLGLARWMKAPTLALLSGVARANGSCHLNG